MGYIFVNRPACGLNWGHRGRVLGWCSKVTPFPFCGSSLVIFVRKCSEREEATERCLSGRSCGFQRAYRAGDDSVCQN